MAELLTHVLAAFVLATVASWRIASIDPPLIVACMIGAAIPDLNRVELLFPAETVTALTGLPWSWGVFHRAGGALLVAIIFALLVREDFRIPVFAMLMVGIASHLVIDYFLWQPTGRTTLMLWPFLDLTLEYQGFYRSSDRWPAAVTIVLAGVTLLVDRLVIADSTDGARTTPTE